MQKRFLNGGVPAASCFTFTFTCCQDLLPADHMDYHRYNQVFPSISLKPTENINLTNLSSRSKSCVHRPPDHHHEHEPQVKYQNHRPPKTDFPWPSGLQEASRTCVHGLPGRDLEHKSQNSTPNIKDPERLSDFATPT